MDRKQLNALHELQDTEYVMKWYGWGSPIGLSIFFLTIAAIVAIIKIVFFG
mgnify:CR=1 FL=1